MPFVITVSNENFLKERPSDLHLRRLSLLYSTHEIRELALQLGLESADFENLLHTDNLETWKFEVLRKCRDRFTLTFKQIREAFENCKIENIHRLCKVNFDEPQTYIL